jgi:hypothetical protein
MCSRVGKTQISNHIHSNQNENHGLFGTTLTIQTRAIDIVMLNKNIPINQQIGATSHNNRKGRDNKRDETQTFTITIYQRIFTPELFTFRDTRQIIP